MHLFRNMLILGIPVFFLLPMFASEALSQQNCARDDFMNLAGSDCWIAGGIKNRDMHVLRDVKISDLRIRHSRIKYYPKHFGLFRVLPLKEQRTQNSVYR